MSWLRGGRGWNAEILVGNERKEADGDVGVPSNSEPGAHTVLMMGG